MDGLSTLAPRERELAEALHRGMSRKDIAASMGISSNTLQNYLNTLYLKLGIRDGSAPNKQSQLVLIVERAKGAKA